MASVALDHHLRGSYWVVAHFHYVMVGGSALALIGALYYWFPKITGRMYREGLAKIHFVSSFVGFNILYFPQFFLLDMPRRVSEYQSHPEWSQLNMISTIGAFVFGLSQLLIFANLPLSLRSGKPAGANPWKGWTLEWSVPSPPPIHNFDTIPVVTKEGIVQFGSGQSGIPNGIGHQSHLSYWPIFVSSAAFLFFLGLVSGLPVIALAIGAGVVALFGYAREQFVVREEEHAESWPFQLVPKIKLGVWTFLASEIIFFGVLLSAYFFVRANSISWPSAGSLFNIQHGAVNTFILLTSSLTAVMALVSAKSNSRAGLVGGLLATLALGSAFLVNKGLEWRELVQEGHNFGRSLVETSYYITTGAHGVHVFAGLVLLLFLISKSVKGRYLNGNHATVEHFGLYWHFVDIVWVFLFPLFYLI